MMSYLWVNFPFKVWSNASFLCKIMSEIQSFQWESTLSLLDGFLEVKKLPSVVWRTLTHKFATPNS